MTATAHATDSHATAGASSCAVDGCDVRAFTWTMAILLGVFLLLQNQFWVPGGDSEVYAGAARNIALGKGYTFNGFPVTLVPPGWSYVLAGAMKISPEFLFLKLLTMSCMLGSLGFMYWICRRFASPGLSGLAVVLTGIISHVYSLTFWLHSDALFCLVSSAALLLALQISEGKPALWRAIVLYGLCMAAVWVRWAGLFTWLMVGAVLLNGELIPRLNDRWYRAFASGLITLLMFMTIRATLLVPPNIARLIRDSGAQGEIAEVIDEPEPGETPAFTLGTYNIFNLADGKLGYVVRMAGWGHWFSFLLWQPLRMGRASEALDLISAIVGWLSLLCLFMLAWRTMLAREWTWLAVLLYSFMLAMNWPNANARYLVPIAPLIVLGIIKGLPILFEKNRLVVVCIIYTLVLLAVWSGPADQWWVWMRLRIIAAAILIFYVLAELWRRNAPEFAPRFAQKSLLAAFVGMIVLCNGALWAVDMYVARSGDFYSAYEAGISQHLVSASKWLNDHPQEDFQISVSPRYVNMGRPKNNSQLGVRVTSMLTGKAIVLIPVKYVRGDPRRNPHFLAWARALDIKYALYQPDVSPWRVFHFRMGWLQEMMTGEKAIDTGAGWRLYYIPPEPAPEGEVDEAQRISLDPVNDWPTRMPGL